MRMRIIVNTLNEPAHGEQLFTTAIYKYFNMFLNFVLLTGFDGGQEQIFVMEVYDQKAQLQSNVSSVVPRFMVSGLKPGMELYLDIFAANRRGRSEKANLEYLMLRSPEIQTSKSFSQSFYLGL